MNLRITRASALVIGIALAGAAVATPQDHDSRPQARSTLDSNHDGAIDRAEAAAHPRLAAHFDRMDRDGDGKIERGERRRHMHRGGKRMHRGDHGAMAAIRLDTDGDGRISTIEAAASRFATTFGEIDRNRDGYLVRSELDAAAEKRRSEFAAKRMQRFEAKFTEADANRDGRLSRAEVEAGWPRHARAFAFLDEDRDGQLSRADLMPRRQR